jgi:hypothetical protein
MEIPFDGAYDKRTFIRGLRLIEKPSLSRRILRWFILIILLFAVGAGIYAWVKEGATTSSLPNLARPALTTVLLGYYYVSPYLSRRIKTDRLFRDKPSRRMSGIVDVEGVLVGPLSGKNARFQWNRFVRKNRQDQLVALLTVDGTIALFHRSFFQSEPDWSRFLQLVDKRVIEPK